MATIARNTSFTGLRRARTPSPSPRACRPSRPRRRPSRRARLDPGSGVCQAGGAGVEVALVGEAGGSPGGRPVGVTGAGVVAGHLQEVGPDGGEPVVPG